MNTSFGSHATKATFKELMFAAGLTVAAAVVLFAMSLAATGTNAFAAPEPPAEIEAAEMPLNLDEVSDWDSFNVLVFTYTAGFRHTDGINRGRIAMQELANEHGFNVTLSEDRGLFTEEGLADFDVVMFLNTTSTITGQNCTGGYDCGDLLNAAQQDAFEEWYRSGNKGWVGAHAASDTEKPEDSGVRWPWYGGLIGNNAWFQSHGGNNDSACLVTHEDQHDHLSVNNPLLDPAWVLPSQWMVNDEWYVFKNNPLTNITPTEEVPHTPIVPVLLRQPGNTPSGNCSNSTYPASWYHEYDNGRSFYTARGHGGNRWDEPNMRNHILGAVLWAAGVDREPDEDAPVTTHTLDPANPPYVGNVTVTLSADDGDGWGIDETFYRIGGTGPWSTYTAPFVLNGNGERLVEYYSVDKAENEEDVNSFTIELSSGTDDTTPPTSSHTLDPAEPNGNDDWYTSDVVVDIDSDDNEGGSGVESVEYSLNGGPWTPYSLGGDGPTADEVILNSASDLANWIQYQPGGFTWNTAEGGFARGTGGMGLLWLPVEYGDFHLKMQWRDSTPAGNGNSGVFVRFPDLRVDVNDRPTSGPGAWGQNPGETYCGRIGTANGNSDNARIWMAIYCGNEIQINDWSGDNRKTGSIYAFKDLNAIQGNPEQQPAGVWVDYEIKIVGQQYEIYRNGALINELDFSTPMDAGRSPDPPSQGRQFYQGYIGLQNHSSTEVIDFRNVRVERLDGAETALTLNQDGTHVVEYRATDADGNVEATKTTGPIKIDKTAPTTTASFSPVAPGAGGVYYDDVSISIAATDGSGSGVDGTEYRIGTTGAFQPFTSPLEFSSLGNYTVQFRSTDEAGNIEEIKQVSFMIAEPGDCASPLNDGFNGSVLDPKWENMRPNADFPPTIGDDHLTLPHITGGDIYGNTDTAHNLLLQDAPSGSWVATLKARHASMTNQDKSVGIALVNNLQPNYYAKVAMQHKGDTDPDTGGNQPGLWAERVLTVNNEPITTPPDTVPYPNSGALTPPGEYLWVRLVRNADNNTYSGWTSLDGETFIKFGADFPGSGLNQNGGDLRIGLFAKKGSGTPDSAADVDYFNVTVGTSDPQLPPDCDDGGGGTDPEDTEAPATTAQVNPAFPNGIAGWYLSSPTVTLTASDNESAAGDIDVFWRLGTSGDFEAYDGPIAVDDDFEGVIQYYAVDEAGNEETVKDLPLKVDLTAPEVNASFTSAAPYGPANPAIVNLAATDATSGVVSTEVNTGSGWVAYDPANPPTFTSAGSYTVQYRANDVAGNQSEAASVQFQVRAAAAATMVVKPKQLKFKRNAKRKFLRVQVTHRDAIAGQRVRVCVKAPKKRLKVQGGQCRNVGRFNSAGRANVRIGIKPHKKRMAGRKVNVRVTLQVPGQKARTVRVRARMPKPKR